MPNPQVTPPHVPPSERTVVRIDARGLAYRALNAELDRAVSEGATAACLENVHGQRYIGTNLQREVCIDIHGVPGNDLGAFMDGPEIHVHNDAQDGCGNTMNSGLLAIHGSAGDIVGHSMRGGSVFVRDDVGYRVGIHMKAYENVRPIVVIGGTAQHFLGEYMAGGVLLVLGRWLPPEAIHPARYVGTGMHGGAIYLRGRPNEAFLGREVGLAPITSDDRALIEDLVSRFNQLFQLRVSTRDLYTKLVPRTKRPYGQIYAY
jgi:glutamate synthase domain-containing protein 3